MSGGRFWCSALDLEEHQAGMWRRVRGEEQARWLETSIALLQDSTLFRAAMRRALVEWPTSCLYNFTNPALNKPVWLAHAGACLVYGVPERFMREGYCALSAEDKARADRDAEEIAAEWRDAR